MRRNSSNVFDLIIIIQRLVVVNLPRKRFFFNGQSPQQMTVCGTCRCENRAEDMISNQICDTAGHFYGRSEVTSDRPFDDQHDVQFNFFFWQVQTLVIDLLTQVSSTIRNLSGAFVKNTCQIQTCTETEIVMKFEQLR